MLFLKTISIQRIEILGLLLVIFFAVSLRFYELDRGYSGLGIYSATSLNTGTSLHNWFFPSIFVDGSIIADKPPLFFWVQGLFLKILGPINMALRLPAALCGTFCVVLLYLILRRTYGVLTAFAGGLFLAIAPIDVNFSRGVFLEPLTTALILLSIFMLLIGVERKQVKFIYIASAVIGIAFMSKLWQGLLPVPALAVFVIILRWEAWGRFLKTATVAFVIFIITALVWPTLVWLFDSHYDAVMHSENIWDMIFGWNLFDRFGGLQYGSTHDPSWFWFLTGPMQIFLGITFIPLAVLGGLKTVYDLPAKIFSKTTSKEKLVPCIGLIWLMWLLICIVGFGGATVRLSSYWASAVPAICALSAIGMVGLIKDRQGHSQWHRAISYTVLMVGLLYISNALSNVVPLWIGYKYLSYLCLLSAIIFPIFLFFKPGVDSNHYSTGERVLSNGLLITFALILVSNLSITFYNLTNPRDDTLGRIGFDQMPVSFGGGGRDYKVDPKIERARLRGTVITAIVRAEPHDLTEAIEYIYRRYKEGEESGRYLMATDSYNTAAKVAYHAAEFSPHIPRLPILPIYSEYQDTWITSLEDLEKISDDGDLKFILTSKDMQTMNFEFWTWLSGNAEDVTIVSGLPYHGEIRLFKLMEEDSKYRGYSQWLERNQAASR